MPKLFRYSGAALLVILLCTAPAFAGEPPAPSIFSNTLAVSLISLMILLLIIIAILGTVLINAADFKLRERKENRMITPAITTVLLLSSTGLFAQDKNATTAKTATNIGGLAPSTFYVMIVVLFLELVVVLVLLLNIKFLLNKEKQRRMAEKPEEVAAIEEAKKNRLSWWDRINKLRPVSQEAELDLGHEYDGIRELNNRLPPWWLYGFYLTVVFAGIYLWRFHVSHTGPSSEQEYKHDVARAEERVKEYLKKKGEAVDENTVTLLTSADDIEAGKSIFMDPSKCPACHGADGGGTIGPNLTDEYWLYGGSVKDIFKTIKYGTNKGMRSWKDDLSAKQIAQVASYVHSLKGSKPAKPKEPQGEIFKEDTIPAKDTAKVSNPTVSLSK